MGEVVRRAAGSRLVLARAPPASVGNAGRPRTRVRAIPHHRPCRPASCSVNGREELRPLGPAEGADARARSLVCSQLMRAAPSPESVRRDPSGWWAHRSTATRALQGRFSLQRGQPLSHSQRATFRLCSTSFFDDADFESRITLRRPYAFHMCAFYLSNLSCLHFSFVSARRERHAEDSDA